MKHVVMKPFAWCPDGTGVTREELAIGDERDFGDIAGSLIAEGYIRAIEPAASEPKPVKGRAK